MLAPEALQALARLEAQRLGPAVRARVVALAAHGGGAVRAVRVLPLTAAVVALAEGRREQAPTAAERAARAMQLMAASRTWPAS